MSAMKELMMDIQYEWETTSDTPDFIAARFNVPVEWVYEALSMMESDDEEYPSLDDEDYMDGDAESALASAGWGTDEDYGGSYNDEF